MRVSVGGRAFVMAMAIDIERACEGARLDLPTQRSVAAFASRFRRLLRPLSEGSSKSERPEGTEDRAFSDTVYGAETLLPAQLHKDLADLKAAIPTVTFQTISLQCGDLLYDLGQVDAARTLCFVFDSSDDDVVVRTRSVFGRARCNYRAALEIDPMLKDSATVSAARASMLEIQQQMRLLLCQPDGERLCWLLYNGTIHLYRMCKPLLDRRVAHAALPFLNWSIVAMETSLPLCAPRYLSWRVTLYSTAVAALLDIGKPANALAAVDRAAAKVAELGRWLEADPPVPAEQARLLRDASGRLDLLRQRCRFVAGQVPDAGKLGELLVRPGTNEKLGDLLSLITLPAPASDNDPHAARMEYALDMGVRLIRSQLEAKTEGSPNDAPIDVLVDCGLHIRLLLLAVAWRRWPLANALLQLVEQRKAMPDGLAVDVAIARLACLAKDVRAADGGYRAGLRTTIRVVLDATAIPDTCPDAVSSALLSIYEGIAVPALAVDLPDRQYVHVADAPDASVLDLLQDVARLWLRLGNASDPMIAGKLVLDLCPRIEPSAAVSLLSSAIDAVERYRSDAVRRLSPRHSVHVDLWSTDTGASYNVMVCLHADLMMQWFRARIAAGESSPGAILRDLSEHRVAQALLLVQVADLRRTRPEKVARWLHRAENLLLMETAYIDSLRDGDEPGCPRLVWHTSTCIALDVGRVNRPARLYGRDALLGTNVSINNAKHKGLGRDVADGEVVIVRGLSPNLPYVFAAQPASSPMGPASPVYVARFPLPLALAWGNLAQVAHTTKNDGLARSAAARVLHDLYEGHASPFPLCFRAAYPSLRSDRVRAGPPQLLRLAATMEVVLSDTLRLPPILSHLTPHMKSLQHAQHFLVSRAVHLVRSMHLSGATGDRPRVLDTAARLYDVLVPILSTPMAIPIVVPSLEQLFDLGVATWTPAVKRIVPRLAHAVIVAYDRYRQAGLALDADRLKAVLACGTDESAALARFVARHTSLAKLPTAGDGAKLDMLLGPDLQPMASAPDLPDSARALLAQEALARGQPQKVPEYIGAVVDAQEPTAARALALLLRAQASWAGTSSSAATASDQFVLGWEWEQYRNVDGGHLAADDAIVKGAPAALPDLGVPESFWSDVRASVAIAARSRAWQQLQNGVALVVAALRQCRRSVVDLRQLHTILSPLLADATDMIAWFREHHDDAIADDGVVVQRHAIHLSYGLRFSSAHDLVSQDEWLWSLWFMPIARLDVDLVYSLLQWTLWALFHAREWQTLVDLADRFDALTDAFYSAQHIHYVIYAQARLRERAESVLNGAVHDLDVLDQDMARLRDEIAARRQLKRSRLGKMEEDQKLAAATDVYNGKRTALKQAVDDATDRVGRDRARLDRFARLQDEVERDRNATLRKLEQARHALYAGMDGVGRLHDVVPLYEKLIEFCRAKQETLVLLRALLDLAAVLLCLGRRPDAIDIWRNVVETVDAGQGDAFERVGVWGCLYGCIAYGRLAQQLPGDLGARADAADRISLMASAILSMTGEHAQVAAQLATRALPAPVFPGTDIMLRPDRVHVGDALAAFEFAGRELLGSADDDGGLKALPVVSILISVARTSAGDLDRTVAGLAMQVQACLQVGQPAEAVDILSRLFRAADAPDDVQGRRRSRSTPPDALIPPWKNDAAVSEQDACVKALCNVDELLAGTTSPDVVLAYGRLLAWLVKQGRGDCAEPANRVLDRVTGPLKQEAVVVSASIASSADCVQRCDDALRNGAAVGRQWFTVRMMQVDALLAMGNLRDADTIAGTVVAAADSVHERSVRRRCLLARAEVLAIRGDEDGAVAVFETLDDATLAARFCEGYLAFAGVLCHRRQTGDVQRAVDLLRQAQDVLEGTSSAMQVTVFRSRYFPVIRPMILTRVALCEATGDGANANEAARLLALLPGPSPYLQAKVLHLQANVCDTPAEAVRLALESANTIVGKCGQEPLPLQRALVLAATRYWKGLGDRGRSACALYDACRVRSAAVKLERDVVEAAAAVANVDRLDAGVLRDLRDLYVAFVLESGAAETEANARKELKLTGADVAQMLICCRADLERLSWRDSSCEVLRRQLPLLHSWLRDSVPAYKATTLEAISYDGDGAVASVPADTVCMCWQPADDTSDVSLLFMATGAPLVLGSLVVRRSAVASVFDAIGRWRQEENAPTSAASLWRTISSALLGDGAEFTVPDGAPPPSANLAPMLQRLFDVDGAQMATDPAVSCVLRSILAKVPAAGTSPGQS